MRNKLVQLFLTIVLIIVGILVIHRIYRETDFRMREDLLTQADLIVQIMEIENIKALSGNINDLSIPEYRILEEKMISVFISNPNFWFIYLMKLNEDKDFIFMFEGRQIKIEEADMSWPSDIYKEASENLYKMIYGERSRITEVSTDKWGTWVSALLPIVDPETNEIIAIFGLDCDAKAWKWVVFERILYPIIMFLLIFFLIIVGFKLINSKEELFDRHKRMNKQREAIELITIHDNDNTSFDHKLEKLSKIIAETLSADIVSIWIVAKDGSGLLCKAKYDSITKAITKPNKIAYNSYSEIICNSLKKQMLAISDITKDKTCSDFIELFTSKEYQTLSIIKACIIHNSLEGVVLVENHSAIRQWHSDEEGFVYNMSLIVSQYIERENKAMVERELVNSNKRFSNTLESFDAGFIYFDEDMHPRFINTNTYNLLGLNYNDINDKELFDTLPTVVSEKIIKYVTNAMRENKELFSVDYFESLNKWIEFKIFPTQNDVSLFFYDVTNKKLTERALLENQRMSIIGEMTNAFSHDFNNYLQVISANVQVLDNLLRTHREVEGYINTIQTMTSDAATRVQLLQRFAGNKYSASEYEKINLNKIVKEVIPQSQAIWKSETEYHGKQIRIVDQLNEIPNSYGNESELRAVLYNLIKNAVEAMPDGGDIVIETGLSGDKVFLHVTDKGCGIPYEIRDRVFEPFVTTKGYEIGKGLGLSAAYNIIKEHNGSITVLNTATDLGTTIEILLPIEREEQRANVGAISVSPANVMADSVSPANVMADSVRPDDNTLKIIWVDDDEMIREIAEEFISIIGFKATIAASGEEALEYMKTNDYNVLITDIGMPYMNGWQLIERVNSLYPNKMKIHIVSGWGNQISEDEMKKFGVSTVISKPIKLAQLQKILQ